LAPSHSEYQSAELSGSSAIASLLMTQLILIGPVGVGKTTTAQLLAEQQSLPHHVLDQLRWSYFEQIGYDPERVQQLAATQGIAAVLTYWERFEVQAVNYSCQVGTFTV